MSVEEVGNLIHVVFSNIDDLVKYKNIKYNGSIDEPINVFSTLNPEEGVKQRIDDKLSRIKGSEIRKNDVADLMGYLAHLCRLRGWTDFNDLKD